MLEGIHPVNDLKAEQELRILRETVKHALALLHGAAICHEGTVAEAYKALARAIGQDQKLEP